MAFHWDRFGIPMGGLGWWSAGRDDVWWWRIIRSVFLWDISVWRRTIAPSFFENWRLRTLTVKGDNTDKRQLSRKESGPQNGINRWSICVSIILLHLGPARLVYCTSNATPRPSYHFSSSLNSNKYRNTMSLSPRTDSTTRRSTPRTFYQFSQLHEELVINVLSYLADVPYKYSSKGEIEVICGK